MYTFTLTVSSEALQAIKNAVAVEHRRAMRDLASAFNSGEEGQIAFATEQYIAAATAVTAVRNVDQGE